MNLALGDLEFQGCWIETQSRSHDHDNLASRWIHMRQIRLMRLKIWGQCNECCPNLHRTIFKFPFSNLQSSL